MPNGALDFKQCIGGIYLRVYWLKSKRPVNSL